jgi:hypothetical protein
VFGEIPYTTYGEKTPAQNALFLFIPDSYFRGWALDNKMKRVRRKPFLGFP